MRPSKQILKMTLSATCFISANLQLTENSFVFTGFRVFSAYFVGLHAKLFLLKKLKKNYKKKFQKIGIVRIRTSDPLVSSPILSHCTTDPLLGKL